MDDKKLTQTIDTFFDGYSRLRPDRLDRGGGCVLLAAIELFEATGEKRFRDCAVGWLGRFVSPDGAIRAARPEEGRLDDILPGRALLFAFRETGEERYRLAAGSLLRQLDEQPRTASGSYWHGKTYPGQVWLDDLFTVQPFRMEAEVLAKKTDRYLDICGQFENARKTMREPATGLYYHGWDESGRSSWAEPRTGHSKGFRLHAMGWVMMALADTIEAMDSRVYDCLRPLRDDLADALRCLLPYRDPETGLFRRIIDGPELPDNDFETSGSAMVAAVIFKACRLRLILEEKYRPAAEKILATLTRDRIVIRDGKPALTGVRVESDLEPEKERRDESAGYSLSEPAAGGGNIGAAALFMAYAQYLKLKKWEVGARWMR